MIPNWKEWNKKDVIFGIIVPTLVVLLIVVISQLDNWVGGGFNIVTGLTMELQELLVLAAIPVVLGLLWNKWAGGASGFLMGMFYSFYWADTIGNMRGSGAILLAYILSPMLIGYMAGALNRNSAGFMRMLISGVIATAIGGIMLFGIFQLSTLNVVTGIEGLLLTVLPRMLVALLVAVVAKVFHWYGVADMHRNPNTPA